MPANQQFKDYMNAQVSEIDKHKWIESEKANRDLGLDCIKQWICLYAKSFREEWHKLH